MPYTVLTLRAADILDVDVKPQGRADVPFLNWSLRASKESAAPRGGPDLRGPGLYGLTFDDRLIYIGSYLGQGRSGAHATGNVASARWWTLIASITARGDRVHLARQTLKTLEKDLGTHPMVRGFVEAAPELFKDNGCLCPLRRAEFAAKHWEIFGGAAANPQQVLQRFSFVYVRVGQQPDDDSVALADRIVAAERRLIHRLSPVCNDAHVSRDEPPVEVPLADLPQLLEAELDVPPPKQAVPMEQFLRTLPPEPLPEWLSRFKEGDPFDKQAFFGSHVVYYPGSGTDSHPVQLFAPPRTAHCFIYADYGLEEGEVRRALERGIAGYRVHAITKVDLRTLAPPDWKQHVAVKRFQDQHHMRFVRVMKPYVLLAVLNRGAGFGVDHGPERIALLFLGGDGIASYDAIFCQKGSPPPPFILVMQDHGFGGNYDRFGDDGLLHRIADECDAMPTLLLVAHNTYSWRGYELLREVAPSPGGEHLIPRYLYRHPTATAQQPAPEPLQKGAEEGYWAKNAGKPEAAMGICEFIPQGRREDAAEGIALAVFGTPEAAAFSEAFVPLRARAPHPKARHFAQFLSRHARLLWCVYSDEQHSEVAGFILIGDLPHPNAIGFGLAPQFAGRGLMTRAWTEILASDSSSLIRYPLNAYTSARNAAALGLLERLGFELRGNIDFFGEPSCHYALQQVKPGPAAG